MILASLCDKLGMSTNIKNVASSTPKLVRDALLKTDAFTPLELIELEEIGVNVMTLQKVLSPKYMALIAVHQLRRVELQQAIKTGTTDKFLADAVAALDIADLKRCGQTFGLRMEASLNIFNATSIDDLAEKK